MARAGGRYAPFLPVAGGVAAVVLIASALRAQEASAARTEPLVTYRLEAVDPPTIKTRFTAGQLGLLEKLNRRDVEHLIRLTEMIVPDAWLEDDLAYSPLPRQWSWAEERPKAIVVSQFDQVFGAYESGKLVRWGPVSSGRKDSPTPAGVFNLTWKAKSRVSTDNDAWLLKWYFNFINSRGVSFHQFDLPGEAASHACIRLLERDAMWLYEWGEQWKLSKDGRTLLQPGTTVMIVGDYAHDRPGPWTSLDWWHQLPIQLPQR